MITANIWQMERHMAGGMARGFDNMGIIARDGDTVAMADRGGDISDPRLFRCWRHQRDVKSSP